MALRLGWFFTGVRGPITFVHIIQKKIKGRLTPAKTSRDLERCVGHLPNRGFNDTAFRYKDFHMELLPLYNCYNGSAPHALDSEKCFYGQRKMNGLGFLRVRMWQNILRVLMRGYVGNKKGEGFILGGLYVIGPECQGILLEHQEKEFGDKADLRSVLEAVRKVVKAE